MKNLNKLLALLLALTMVFALCACGSETGEEESGETELDTAVEEQEASSDVPEEVTAALENAGTTYTVYVVDEDGNPVSGGIVQFCLESCTPVVIDENGVATFTAEEADYAVKMLSMPAGYTYATEEEAFYFAAGSCELTIVLKPEA